MTTPDELAGEYAKAAGEYDAAYAAWQALNLAAEKSGHYHAADEYRDEALRDKLDAAYAAASSLLTHLGYPTMIEDNCTVGIDNEKFPAYDNDVRWNGFVCPTFRRDVVEEIREWINGMAEEHGRHAFSTIEWDGEVAVVTDHQWTYQSDYTPDRYEPDQHGRYAIGAGSWAWFRTDGEEG